jgi:hypothetical protein
MAGASPFHFDSCALLDLIRGVPDASKAVPNAPGPGNIRGKSRPTVPDEH